MNDSELARRVCVAVRPSAVCLAELRLACLLVLAGMETVDPLSEDGWRAVRRGLRASTGMRVSAVLASPPLGGSCLLLRGRCAGWSARSHGLSEPAVSSVVERVFVCRRSWLADVGAEL